jgi:hypothetical protein
MLQILLLSKEKRRIDYAEVKRLYAKYADNAVRVVRMRSQDDRLPDRDRRHWKRIYRTMILLGRRIS